MERSVLKSTIAVLFYLLSATVMRADVHLFGPLADMDVKNMGELTQNQRDGLEKFQTEQPYFGAIFMEKNGSGWGSFTGAHTMNDAMEAAIRICQSHAEEGQCRLVGVIYPAGMDTQNISENTLSQRATEKFEIYNGRTQGYRAFARSSMNTFGWATRRETAQDAVEAALTYCFTSSMEKLINLQVGVRTKAVEDGLYTCRIIDSAGPSDPS